MCQALAAVRALAAWIGRSSQSVASILLVWPEQTSVVASAGGCKERVDDLHLPFCRLKLLSSLEGRRLGERGQYLRTHKEC